MKNPAPPEAELDFSLFFRYNRRDRTLFDMKFKFPYKIYNADYLIRRAGYGRWEDKEHGVISYTRKLGASNYPRFHVHLQNFEKYFEVGLHLDQKQPSYLKEKAHSGEYEGPVVEDEARRITAVIAEIYDEGK
jgi:hypothetical protein